MGAVVLLPSCQRHFNGTHQGFSPRVSVWRFICFYFNVVLTLTSGQFLWFKWSLQFFFSFFFYLNRDSVQSQGCFVCLKLWLSCCVLSEDVRSDGPVLQTYHLYLFAVLLSSSILIRYKHGDKNILHTWKTPWTQGITNIATEMGHIKLIDI